MREMLSIFLKREGYVADVEPNGSKGLTRIASAEPYDLVITDLVMPGMSGRELIEHLRRLAPNMPILSTSGYARSLGETDDGNYLRKPFTSQDLLRRVKQALLQPPSS